MKLTIVGVNHTTANVLLREKIALLPHDIPNMLKTLTQCFNITEAMIISTCNRLEVVFYGDIDADSVIQCLMEYKNIPLQEGYPSFYVYHNESAVKHLLIVASGMDSMILGEPQIFGQVKSAYQDALNLGYIAKELDRLLQYVFAVVKEIRTETEIGKHAVSVASSAFRLAQQHVEVFSDKTILLIGSGETASLLLKYISTVKPKKILIASRSPNHATGLAMQYKAELITINHLAQYISKSDLVFSATACPYPIVDKMMLQEITHEMIIFDLALPRDIEPDVDSISQVTLYCIDDIQDRIKNNITERQKAANIVNSLILKKTAHYTNWINSLNAVTTIKAYREGIEKIRDDEINLALKQLKSDDPIEEIITRLAYRLTNKIMHKPTAKIREAVYNGHDATLDLAAELFDID